MWQKVAKFKGAEYFRKALYSEDVARDAIWAESLVKVNTVICLTHVGHGEPEPTVLGSGPCRCHCVILKTGEEGV